MKIFGRVPALRATFRIFFSGFRKFNNIKYRQDDPIRLSESLETINYSIEKSGFSRGVSLTQASVAAINEYAASNSSYAYLEKHSGFLIHERLSAESKLKKKILLSHYCNVFEKCSEIKTISDSEALLTIAKNYLGTNAKRIATQLWWTFPVKVDDETRSKVAHFFHRDLDGWAFIKFFFYITPVHPGEGAHVFAEASHRPGFKQMLKEKFRISRHSDDAVSSWYPNISEITGPAGMGLAEDTFGLHKGLTPKSEPRLILCVVFGHNSYKGIQEFTAAPHELQNI
jgi:hypothetical protein